VVLSQERTEAYSSVVVILAVGALVGDVRARSAASGPRKATMMRGSIWLLREGM